MYILDEVDAALDLSHTQVRSCGPPYPHFVIWPLLVKKEYRLRFQPIVSSNRPQAHGSSALTGNNTYVNHTQTPVVGEILLVGNRNFVQHTVCKSVKLKKKKKVYYITHHKITL